MFDIDNALALYVSGVPADEVAKQFKVSRWTIFNHMKARGLVRRKGTDRAQLPADWSEYLSRYDSGMSVNAIANAIGVNRATVNRWLKISGETPRGRSEAEFRKWESMTESQRANQVRKAHDAVRGSKHGEQALLNRSASLSQTMTGATFDETRLAYALEERGFMVTQQLPVGKYNIDVAIHSPSVAVELFGGRWHTTGKHARSFFPRGKYILSKGFMLIVVWSVRDHLLEPLPAAKTIHALAQRTSRNESGCRRYQVILGDGKTAPARDCYFNDAASVERLGCTA